jgi:peptidoglycan/LPS O-acetylase OafA/YrhL
MMTFTTIQFWLFGGVFAVALLWMIPLSRIFRLDAASHRYQHLDGLRGIAAVTVVACHTNQHLLSFFGFKPLPEYGNRAAIIAVEMFFALTAFLFTERALKGLLDTNHFYVSRVRRIVPLYIFAAVATVPIALYYAPVPITNVRVFLGEIVDVFTFGFLGAPTLTVQGFNAMSLIGVAWTLNFEWKFYLILPVVFAIYRYSKRAGLAACLAIGIVAVHEFYVIGEVVWPFFFSGCLAAFLKQRVPNPGRYLRNVLSISGFVLIPAAIWVPGYFSFSHLLLAVPMFLCFLFGEPGVFKYRLPRLLGTISYSIYLLQYLVLLPIVNTGWGHHIGSARPAMKFAVALSIIIVLIPLSCLTYRFIELPWMALPQRHESALKLGGDVVGNVERTQSITTATSATLNQEFVQETETLQALEIPSPSER